MNSSSLPDDFPLDASFRGFPLAHPPLLSSQVASRGWAPSDGAMNLPLLSMDMGAFRRNLQAMLAVCASEGAAIAPHIKTPMAPALARQMVEAGAWGVSVADTRQAHVMLSHGLTRLILANEVGGNGGAGRLEALCAAWPAAEIMVFCDAPEALAALVRAWAGKTTLRPRLLLEVGMGRGGATSNDAFDRLLHHALGSGFPIAGIAAYEGPAMRPHTGDSAPFVAEFLTRVQYAVESLRSHAPGASLTLSIGGSALFDYVFSGLRSLLARDKDLRLICRSGAAVFGDHGMIRKRLDWVAERGLMSEEICALIRREFQPTLRLWAEVLSVPEAGKAICGFGMRDAGDDQGLPLPLRLWRGGQVVGDLFGSEVTKLNDQHAFLSATAPVEVGDVIEFGIRHPCTTIDKHAVIWGLEQGKVAAAWRTFFG